MIMRRYRQTLPSILLVISGVATQGLFAAEQPALPPTAWPVVTSTMRPWMYWWWPGSAVDQTNLTRQLQRYHDVGLGGVHVIPIYGVKGSEDKYVQYLTPRWMDMLAYTVTEGDRLGLGVDMTLGTGWCFGGPQVTDLEANALVVVKTNHIAADEGLNAKFDRETTQALVAFSDAGKCLDLTDRIREDGSVDWTAEGGPWMVYAVSQRPSGQKVKRAAPGGEGHMLNPFYAEAVRHFLAWFDGAFTNYTGPKPRAVYHDSYEYRCDWSPDLFAQFEKRRGYRLQTQLPAFFDGESGDLASRVKCDYRETVSDMMVENFGSLWTPWAHELGFIVRNEAHGSPGNLLDLYAAADIPETEFFRFDRNPFIAKFASSAAHVTGRKLVSSETGTWLAEHFNVTLGELKLLVDEFFVSGVNHVFYHGTCYSPDEAPWPGWLFYASTEMNPRNSIWHDVPTLNTYIARCQAVLQSGQPDNDILLYWPIYDLWHNPTGKVQNLAVHHIEWFSQQPIGLIASQLWKRGYAFDYVSDHQLATAQPVAGSIDMAGVPYRVVVIPPSDHIPLDTFKKLLALAENGATVIFQERLPEDVPGLWQLDGRRRALRELLKRVKWSDTSDLRVEQATLGKGRFLLGRLEPALALAGVEREPLVDHPGALFIRRALESGRHYFIANQGGRPLDDWVTLATSAGSVVLMDAMTGRVGLAPIRRQGEGKTEVYLQLQPGESVVVRTVPAALRGIRAWRYWKVEGDPVEIKGHWRVKFIAGGPELPRPFETTRLASWTDQGDTNAQRFAGTALYTITFDSPAGAPDDWLLDLGKVCCSARVRLNGHGLGTLITAPFRLVAGALELRNNVLEVEVTSLSANRIRDLDRRGVQWKIFHDINFVNVNYKPFDASNWPLRESGLLGPVRLLSAKRIDPARN